MKKFYRDLEYGKEAEEWVASYIEETYGFTPEALNEDWRYDISITEAEWTVEVKRDFRSTSTHRFCIPYKKHGKPAGISITEADVWCQVPVEGEYHFFRTDELKDAIDRALKDGIAFTYHHKNKDDDCHNYIIPKEYLKPYELNEDMLELTILKKIEPRQYLPFAFSCYPIYACDPLPRERLIAL